MEEPASDKAYNPDEAAIHMVQYQIVLPFCDKKRVLDLACGEGYGASFLQQNGALHVDGVDSSQEAVKTAEKLFKHNDIDYHAHDISRVDELFEENSFDVILSFETIGHLTEPSLFLTAIKKLARQDAVIIITCSNDHWHTQQDEQKTSDNPHKYTFEEFQRLSSRILGDKVRWGLGVPVFGFGNIPLDKLPNEPDIVTSKSAISNARPVNSEILLPSCKDTAPTTKTCSFFTGVWGGHDTIFGGSVVYPASMDHYADMHSWQALLSKNETLEYENEKIRIQAFALGRELNIVLGQIAHLTEHITQLQQATITRKIARRVKSYIPDFLMPVLLRMAKLLNIR